MRSSVIINHNCSIIDTHALKRLVADWLIVGSLDSVICDHVIQGASVYISCVDRVAQTSVR